MSSNTPGTTNRTLQSGSARKRMIWMMASSVMLVLMLVGIGTGVYMLNQRQGTPADASWPDNLKEFILCAPDQCSQYPAERVVYQGTFEAGDLHITGTITRNSGDEQLNEHVLIFLDDKQIFSSFDQPGMPVDAVENISFTVKVTEGLHTLTVRHGDDSANPTSSGSVAVQISWDQVEAPTPTPTVPQQTQCPLIKIYNEAGQELAADEMVMGETIRLGIKRDISVLSNPSRAQFSTDGGANWHTTNTLNTNDEFIWDFEVPNSSSITIIGQLCDSTTCI